MKTNSRPSENHWFRVLVLVVVVIAPPIPVIALGWQPLAGSPQGIIALVTILGSYALYFGALGALANATGFSLRDWLGPRKDVNTQPSITSIGDGTQILQGTGDNIHAGVVIKNSTVTLPPASVISPPSSIAAPHALPAPPGDFTGRKDEIEKLTKELVGGTRVAISGLAGMGGVGKTALALYVANHLKPQYPDAQIMLEMKGMSHEPLSATEAMTQVIHTFDPTADLRQATQEQIHAFYRNVLGDKRALLLFDNAADAAQVKPLIPPTSCAMLVTSRRHFVLPGMETIRLDMLPEADARKLLLTICPRIGEHADQIAKLCGRLPLALRIAASALAEHRDLRVHDYVASFANRRKRLATLKSASDPELDLEATFEYSYALLNNDTKAHWRALAVFPAPFDWLAAMSVWVLEKESTRMLLGNLVRFSLLDYDGATERYSLHDLLVDFANARLSDEERATAQLRHAQHYAQVAAYADELYLKGGENVLRGLNLFDSEWLHINAGQAWAAANVEASDEAANLCCDYPGAAPNCISLRLHASIQIGWLQSVVLAARKLEYKRAESGAYGNLGIAYAALGEMRKAIEYHEQALAISREIGDRHGEGADLGNLGNAYADLGETRRAIEYHEQALAIDRATSNRRGEMANLANLGVVYSDLGETYKAIEFYKQALEIAREIGDRRSEGSILGNLGNTYRTLDKTRKAIEYHEQALAIAREISDRGGEGSRLGNLGTAYDDLGETGKAIEYLDIALAITREIQDHRGEANCLNNLGEGYAKLGDTHKAIEYYEQALAIFRQIEDKVHEAKVERSLEKLRARNGAAS